MSGARLRPADCGELAASITHILADLVAVTERLAEATAHLDASEAQGHAPDRDPLDHVNSAAQHLADLRTRLSSAVASAGSYGHDIHALLGKEFARRDTEPHW
jgi:hypothetical protein